MRSPNRLLMFVVAERLRKDVDRKVDAIADYDEIHLLEWKAYLEWKAEQLKPKDK